MSCAACAACVSVNPACIARLNERNTICKTHDAIFEIQIFGVERRNGILCESNFDTESSN